MRYLAALLMLVTFSAFAATGDIEAVVTDGDQCLDAEGAPIEGGVDDCPITARKLYVKRPGETEFELVGDVEAGANAFGVVAETPGDYVFRVDWITAAGVTPGDELLKTWSQLLLREKGTLTITISCDPCIQTTQ